MLCSDCWNIYPTINNVCWIYFCFYSRGRSFLHFSLFFVWFIAPACSSSVRVWMAGSCSPSSPLIHYQSAARVRGSVGGIFSHLVMAEVLLATSRVLFLWTDSSRMCSWMLSLSEVFDSSLLHTLIDRIVFVAVKCRCTGCFIFYVNVYVNLVDWWFWSISWHCSLFLLFITFAKDGLTWWLFVRL